MIDFLISAVRPKTALHFRFLQMPLFTKSENELTTHFDKGAKTLQVANFNQEELDSYEQSQKAEQQKVQAINNLRSLGVLTDEQIALVQGVSIEFVQKVKSGL